ncbi:23S rRNA (adenine(2030)-N(6))-methyltransferase RlmJ [Hahella sp. SMD15-11]|uniref:Ribosomal RNA large subunit methyltransferase J n=1 Tax=Thermohahella caldifontis TaxID=3142973 RepID=A0AB39UUT1_9GAMM
MLSYQHGFHAGNFADVHKHWICARVLDALCAKPKPWMWYETHAGRALYDLHSEQARKTGEADEGIVRLLAAGDAPEVFGSYLSVQRSVNDGETLRWYAGSPLLAARREHEGRALTLCELHPGEWTHLKQALAGVRSCHLHHRDGFEGIAALVPPAQGRGAILVDPSYEDKADYTRIPRWAKGVLRRWRGAVIAVWYPILAVPHHRDLLMGLKAQGLRHVWRSELIRTPGADSRQRMLGSGMVLINPPWRLADDIASGWDWLVETLKADAEASTGSQIWIPE